MSAIKYKILGNIGEYLDYDYKIKHKPKEAKLLESEYVFPGFWDWNPKKIFTRI